METGSLSRLDLHLTCCQPGHLGNAACRPNLPIQLHPTSMETCVKASIILVLSLLAASCPGTPARLQCRALQQELNTTAVPPAAAADNTTTDSDTTTIAAATAAAVQPKAAYECYQYTPRELEAIAAGQPRDSVCTGHGFVFDRIGGHASLGCGTCWCCAPLGKV
jgi:hypothetical protein